MLPPQCDRPSFTPIQNNRQSYTYTDINNFEDYRFKVAVLAIKVNLKCFDMHVIGTRTFLLEYKPAVGCVRCVLTLCGNWIVRSPVLKVIAFRYISRCANSIIVFSKWRHGRMLRDQEHVPITSAIQRAAMFLALCKTRRSSSVLMPSGYMESITKDWKWSMRI